MSFFAVLRKPGEANFTVRKLDINLCVLPGLFGRHVIFCDIGICAEITESPTVPRPHIFELALPFVAEPGITDLIPTLRRDGKIANLVFGIDADPPKPHDGAFVYDDGDQQLRFLSLDVDACTQRLASPRSSFSLWTIVADRPLRDGEVVYLRLRLRVADSARMWVWLNNPYGGWHAIADLRVNDLRESPDVQEGPDLQNTMRIPAVVNCFVAVPSYLKTGRVSPTPNYVRILEGSRWEQYLHRRIGAKKSVMVVTHWKGGEATEKSPFRALQEVERRRHSAMKDAYLAAAAVGLLVLLLLPPLSLRDSLLATIAENAVTWALGISAATLIAVWRIAVPLFANGRYKRIGKLLRWYEQRKYRLP